MSNTKDNRWRGLNHTARARIEERDYSEGIPAAGDYLRADDPEPVMIPGVEILGRTIHPQRHRGFLGELGRESEGRLHAIGFWPKQWAAARMYAATAKGFHIHPPSIPDGEDPGAWFQRLYVEEPENYALRPYSEEQWDAMFFIQGLADLILVDEREGMHRNVMRFFIDGDDIPGPNNAGVVIPAGVAHAIRSANSTDLLMVYGTSTVFHPEFEGRIESGLERPDLPPEWQAYLGTD